ncbi:hypothetical protein COCON_G00200490 [Conger conger]|uniref:Coiled-coil domain-containing protein 80 n=1 Tax=Conger conger TaxID=82655 RepID=A0A9Q1D264_CONCO|nr:hypothetical protein COCON_G00200490 [Conger conger]
MFWAAVALLALAWAGADAGERQAEGRGNLRRLPNKAHSQSEARTAAGGDAQPAFGAGGQGRPGAAHLRQFAGRAMQTRRMLAGRRPAQQQGSPRLNGMVQDDGAPRSRARLTRVPSGAGSPNLLASFAGKNRVLVISAPHDSDGYYRLMMSLLKPDVYCELAERHVQQIVVFHQEGEAGGKVRRITSEGKVVEEPLDAGLVPRLMNFLKLERGKFGMVLLKKTLQVEERYPYPVRLEAMYEAIDRTPMRKLEKSRQRGFVQKCKGAGVEGQVVEEGGAGAQVDTRVERKPVLRKPVRRPAQTTTTLATTTTTTTTTTRPTTTTTTTTRPTTTTRATTTTRPTSHHDREGHHHHDNHHTSHNHNHYHHHQDNRKDRHRHKVAPDPTAPSEYYTKAYTGQYGDNRTDKKDYNRKQAGVEPTQHKPARAKPPQKKKKKNGGKVLSNEYEEMYPGAGPKPEDPEGSELEVMPTKKGRGKHGKPEKKKKKSDRPDKSAKRNKHDKKAKAAKEGKGDSRNRRPGKKASKNKDKDTFQKPSKKTPPPKGALASFFDYFESRRRLIVITSPHEENNMYIQQRDEYLESVCEMALRKVSIITIFGALTNSTMKIDHYQLEHDKPMKGMRHEDLVNKDLIIQIRKEFGMMYNFDLKLMQSYEVPIAMKAVFDHIDTFTSRIDEMAQQKKDGVVCKKEDKPRSLENFLSRFRWRRRLFIISAPNDEEWAYQQQLYALTSQACNLGLRHISILKLVGVDAVDMGGVLELYPINGSATVEREGISAALVKDIRNYFQISPEYFSMLLVGKDGNVKSWYPSPMWSMANIYDLVDSMQLRRQEMAIQQSLGMRCPEDEYGGYGYHHHGYHDGYQDGYHQGYGY